MSVYIYISIYICCCCLFIRLLCGQPPEALLPGGPTPGGPTRSTVISFWPLAPSQERSTGNQNNKQETNDRLLKALWEPITYCLTAVWPCRLLQYCPLAYCPIACCLLSTAYWLIVLEPISITHYPSACCRICL